ncbi:MAG TPA: hypothetical protein VMI75_33930 [Polyangiaceae bacterium]|nr:hypothetical protein [Polyangiaceae bacterium]
MAPYREPAPPREEPGPEPHYVPLTRKQERLRRWLRVVPVVLLTLAALWTGRLWLLVTPVVYGLAVIVSDRLHARSLNGRLKAIAGTLARGSEPFVVSRALEAVVADSRPYPGFHSVALLFLGIARARGGDLDGALDLLYVVQRAGWLARRPVWLAWLYPWLSQLHCARGEVDLAGKWLEVARTALPASRHGVLASPEALLALRQGRYEEAIVSIEAYLRAEEVAETTRAHFSFLRAFAYERAGRPLLVEEVRAVVAARLASEGHALPVEKWWPELAAFVDAHAPRGSA